MRFLKTKTTVVLLAGFGFIAGSVARASTIEQLFLDAQTSAGVSVASATIEVSDLGIVTCTGTCGGLVFASSITPHETLLVTGKLGQFTVGATGVGGLSAFYPTLQNLNQIDAASTGAGNLVAFFTDTDYCLGAGGCFGPQFILSVSTVNDTRISTSSTDFAAFVDGGNAIPAGNLVGSFAGLTGLAAAQSGTFANPVGDSGSLSTATVIHFTGKGSVQANLQISTIVPEPSSFALFGIAAGFVAMKLRRRKA